MAEATKPKMLLKLSGEVLAGKGGTGLDAEVLSTVASQLVKALNEGARIAAVLGGGNIFRGLGAAAKNMDRVIADQMGMLATIINGLALTDAVRAQGGKAELFTAFPVGAVGEPYSRDRALRAVNDHALAVLSGGTGNPFFSTDSGAALRAAELGCDVFLKGTKVDGVYDKDPAKFSDAKRFDEITVDDVIERRLGIIDLTAATLCRENRIDIRVYKMTDPDIIYRVASGRPEGTLITSGR
jgi:uridylate kinase